MALNLQLQLKQAQQLVMTPQLQMSIKLLQFSRLELTAMIKREMELNPALEEMYDEEPGEKIEEADELSPDREVVIEEKINDDIDWTAYFDEYNSTGTFETEKKESFNTEAVMHSAESLTEHLLWQLSMAFDGDDDRAVGNYIIGNLSPDGYLEATLAEIATATGQDLKRVEAALSEMQTFDPLGVCARNVVECLLIQAEQFDFEDSGVRKEFLIRIIKDHLDHLKNRNSKAIQKKLNAKPEDIIAALNVIRQFDPKPGFNFLDENPQYIIPDIFVYKLEGEFVIALNDEGLPKLRINRFYKAAMLDKKKAAGGDAQKYIKDHLNSAAWLIRSIHQRQKTIYKVMESILKFQADFFEHGLEKLKPLVLNDVAADIEMHQSTVSRVTTNKYVHTPRGLFELKFFFDNSIKSSDSEDVSSASVQEKIARMIKEEDKNKPITDSQISDLLKKENISLARRTVAKYRDMLKILPSSRRRQL